MPPSLQGVTLASIDAGAGIAIVRRASGEYAPMRSGDFTPERDYRLTRIYEDRVEFSLAGNASVLATRYWLTVGEPSAVAVTSTPPGGRARYVTPETQIVGGPQR
ncbi:hypothetical protein [Usitatibacter rugosus]|uniref:hypothetical protein n=1 Tax=Usitatibacter rugosus TaxID=2732067 RepID=UPI001488F9FD|nr:hypothetical protein [Usitatibacter rugosus]